MIGSAIDRISAAVNEATGYTVGIITMSGEFNGQSVFVCGSDPYHGEDTDIDMYLDCGYKVPNMLYHE